jgi:hypothetical protein
MACRAFKIQVKGGQKIRKVAPAFCRLSRGRLALAGGGATKETGSVVGIQFEVTGMYTGTLISDLMAAVDRVEHMSEQQRIADDQELHAIFAMQIPVTQGHQTLTGQIFMGAA